MSALSNARWLIVIQGYKILLQLTSMAVLARLLPPSDYGLMAMAWTAANFAGLLKDLGTSSAIIQKKELDEETKSAVFWLQMSLAVVLCVALVVASGLIANGFRHPELQPILCLLALTFPLGSLSSTHQALLERESRFQTLARIEIVASSLSLVVAIVAALNGAGVYAFVWQSFTTTALYVIQPWLALHWRPRFEWKMERIRALFGYSGNLSAFNLLNFAARNADSMVIGRFLGASALGAYSMAYKLMLFPLQNLTFVASRALFPVMSRKQDADAEVGSLYLRAIGMVAAISFPLMGGLMILREPLVAVLFGSQWGEVARLILFLAPVGALQSVVSPTGTVFMAKGRTDLLLRLGGLSAVMTIAAFFVGVPFGVVGVAGAYLLANLLLFVPQTYFSARVIALPYGDFLKALLPPVLCTALMLPVPHFVAGAVAGAGMLASLVIASVAGAITYLALYALLFPRRLRQLLHALLGARFASRRGGETPTWLFVDLAEEFGGHEVMLLRWIEELKAGGFVRPVVVCFADSRLAKDAAERCEVVTLEHLGGERGGPMHKVKYILRIHRTLRRLRKAMHPEVSVIAEGSLYSQRFALYASLLARLYTIVYVPLVASFESMQYRQAAALERKIRLFYGRLPHAWLTITEAQAEEFRAWSGVRKPIFTLPNTVQTVIEEHFARGLETRRSFTDRPMDVLVLGRLEHHQKGLDLLLDYLKVRPDLADDFVVHFAGDGSFADTLREEKRRDERLDRLIRIEPWCSALEVFGRSDALLLPSRYEGVPLVMLEAMAFGLPVMASDLAGTRAYLPSKCLFPVGALDQAFAGLSTMRRSQTRAARIAAHNLRAFKLRASGAAFTSAVRDLAAELGRAAHSR